MGELTEGRRVVLAYLDEEREGRLREASDGGGVPNILLAFYLISFFSIFFFLLFLSLSFLNFFSCITLEFINA